MYSLLLAIIYLAFISLGLPDALLGSAWPTMYREFSVPVSYAGVISVIISIGTITSSLLSDRITHRFGPGKVTAISVALTAGALLGFSVSHSFWMLCLLAIPYGLGAGSVDASLNNYVALHYSSRHMSWLHCMWGVGASIGPYIMGYVLSGGNHWSGGYRIVGIIQVVLSVLIFLSLGLWKQSAAVGSENGKAQPMGKVLKIPGAKEIMIAFFCYCALEQTAGLWASSYLALYKGVSAETAAFFGGMFYIGITVGRFFNGFLTMRFTDTQLIRLGEGIIGLGVAALLLPLGERMSIVGLILVGLGCAPIYPCIIHSTPEHFGEENSQAMVGVQMASAYCGSLLMPPVFGLVANHITPGLLPVYLLVILAVMVWMYEKMRKANH